MLYTRAVAVGYTEHFRIRIHAIDATQTVSIVELRELLGVEFRIVVWQRPRIGRRRAIARLRFPHVRPIRLPAIFVWQGVEAFDHAYRKLVVPNLPGGNMGM